MSEVYTTFQEDFDQAHAHLVEMGAAVQPLEGMITPEDRPAFRAIFHATVEPPELTQIVPSGHGNMTATYTRISMGENDTPIVETGRYTYDVPEGAAAIYAAVTDPNLTRTGHPAGEVAEAFFDGVYQNAMDFVPASAN